MENQKIFNDAFENEQHICSGCDCPKGNHLIFFSCPIFEGNPICLDCCRVDALKNNIDKKFSEKLGREVTKEWINEQCRKCGNNSACQNEELANKLEQNATGGTNESEQQGPKKTR